MRDCHFILCVQSMNDCKERMSILHRGNDDDKEGEPWHEHSIDRVFNRKSWWSLNTADQWIRNYDCNDKSHSVQIHDRNVMKHSRYRHSMSKQKIEHWTQISTTDCTPCNHIRTDVLVLNVNRYICMMHHLNVSNPCPNCKGYRMFR